MSRPVSSGVLDDVFGALSHSSRRQILVILFARGGRMSAGEIADRFKHSWPTTTRHLGVLEKANLLSVDREGRQRIYSLQPKRAVQAADWLLKFQSVEGVAAEAEEDWRSLPYARMRNAIPAKGNSKSGSKSGSKPEGK